MKNLIHATPLLLAAFLPGDFVRTLSFVPCGDWNGDGVSDLAIGLPRDDLHGEDAGRVLVLSGRDGSTLREMHTGVARSGFGFALAAGTDVDQDGRLDLVVTSHRDGFGQVLESKEERDRSGRVHVYSVAAVKAVSEFDQPDDFGVGRAFGSGIHVVADVDSDRVRDLLVISRAEAQLDGGNSFPAVILSAKSGRRLRTVLLDLESSAIQATDLNGDGAPDLVAGNSGKVQWLSFTQPGLRTIDAELTAPMRPVRIADVGDLDGDGCNELAVIGTRADRGPDEMVRVVSLPTKTSLFEITSAWMRTLARDEASAGVDRLDVCGAPDLDGDGCGELFVVLPGARRHGFAALISSETGRPLWTAAGNAEHPIGMKLFQYDVQDVQRIPDLDGDGLDDLGVSAAGASTSIPYEEVGARLSVLSSRTGVRIATFEFTPESAPRVRFPARPDGESRPK